jgi:hypothetical protein
VRILPTLMNFHFAVLIALEEPIHRKIDIIIIRKLLFKEILFLQAEQIRKTIFTQNNAYFHSGPF